MSSFAGKYIFDRGEKVDEYLISLDVGVVVRKVYDVTQPELDITYDPITEMWSIIVESTFHKYQLNFKLDETVESDQTFDIRRCRTIITKDKNSDDILRMTQTPDEGPKVETKIEKLPNGGIRFDMECAGKKAVQIFKLLDTASGDAGVDADSDPEAILQEID